MKTSSWQRRQIPQSAKPVSVSALLGRATEQELHLGSERLSACPCYIANGTSFICVDKVVLILGPGCGEKKIACHKKNKKCLIIGSVTDICKSEESSLLGTFNGSVGVGLCCFVCIPKLAIAVKPSGLETWWYVFIPTSVATVSFYICSSHICTFWMYIFLSWHWEFQKFLRSNNDISVMLCPIGELAGTSQSSVSKWDVRSASDKVLWRFIAVFTELTKLFPCISGNMQSFESSFLESFILYLGAMSPLRPWYGER